MTRALDTAATRRVAYDLVSRKAWSRRELGARLVRRGAPRAVAAQVVAELEGRGYVDDRAFARQWAERRAAGERLGSRRLAEELRAKGIAPSLAEAAVREAFLETGEEARAIEAGRRRLPTLERQNPGRAPLRLRDYLLRRGYPAEIVSRVVRQLLKIDAPES